MSRSQIAPSPSQRERLDIELVARGLVRTRSQARGLIMAGEVRVDDEVTTHAGLQVSADAHIELKERKRFVSRGGDKLAHALNRFDVDPSGAVCADIGASTGGFTDCLLQAGASRVYAIDVGYGQLDYQLRNDPRVIVMERTNARYLDSLPEPVSLATIDVSFISLRHILPVARRLLEPNGVCIALIKPQFEAGREEVGKGGVVKDPAVHRSVLNRVPSFASGFEICGLERSQMVGPAGNIEFLGHFRRSEHESAGAFSRDAIERVVQGETT